MTLSAVSLTIGLTLLAFAPAHTADATCAAPSTITDLCGEVSNDGTSPVVIATRFVDPTTVEGIARILSPHDTSDILTTPRGSLRDWDAVWVPAGACVRAEGGLTGSSVGYTDRVDQPTGRWHKIDNLGATVKLTYGSCPGA
jgi:hypothetical protein